MKAEEFIKQLAPVSPDNWENQKGYIVTTSYNNKVGKNLWTEGVAYVVLDGNNIAWKLDGDSRDDTKWAVSSLEDFIEEVKKDLKMWESEEE